MFLGSGRAVPARVDRRVPMVTMPPTPAAWARARMSGRSAGREVVQVAVRIDKHHSPPDVSSIHLGKTSAGCRRVSTDDDVRAFSLSVTKAGVDSAGSVKRRSMLIGIKFSPASAALVPRNTASWSRRRAMVSGMKGCSTVASTRIVSVEGAQHMTPCARHPSCAATRAPARRYSRPPTGSGARYRRARRASAWRATWARTTSGQRLGFIQQRAVILGERARVGEPAVAVLGDQ